MDIVGFATVALLVLSVIAALALRSKYLELICHFRVQYFIGAFALGLVCVAIAEWAGAAFSLASALINLPAFASLCKVRRSGDGTGRRFKLMLMNVYRLNRQHRLCIECVRRHRPDVVVVQELDEVWARELECLRGDYPFAEVRPMGDGSGIVLYSRVAFESLPFGLPDDKARPGILAKLSGYELTILSIHPRAPIHSAGAFRVAKSDAVGGSGGDARDQRAESLYGRFEHDDVVAVLQGFCRAERIEKCEGRFRNPSELANVYGAKVDDDSDRSLLR